MTKRNTKRRLSICILNYSHASVVQEKLSSAKNIYCLYTLGSASLGADNHPF